MIRLFVVGICCLLVLSACKSDDGYQKVTREYIATIERLNDALEDVKTGPDASKAIPKLDDITRDLASVAQRVQNMPPPTPEQQKKMAELDPQIDRQRARLVQNLSRILSDPKLKPIFGEVAELRAALAKFRPEPASR